MPDNTYTLYRRGQHVVYFAPVVEQLPAASLDDAIEEFGKRLIDGKLRTAFERELFIVGIDQDGGGGPLHLLRAHPLPVRLTRISSDADLAMLVAGGDHG